MSEACRSIYLGRTCTDSITVPLAVVTVLFFSSTTLTTGCVLKGIAATAPPAATSNWQAVGVSLAHGVLGSLSPSLVPAGHATAGLVLPAQY